MRFTRRIKLWKSGLQKQKNNTINSNRKERDWATRETAPAEV